MAAFSHDGFDFEYIDEGAGEPVILVHGFASNKHINWVQPGWMAALEAAGFRVVAFDNRGHGASTKSYVPEAYHPAAMASDVLALANHLGIARFHLFGYSMGARIAAYLALRHPERVTCLVLGGMGINLVTGLEDSEEIIAALTAETLDEVQGATGRQFRIFADHSRADRAALAACMISSREPMPEADIRRIGVPALVAVGETDDMAGDPHRLAELLPKGEAFTIPKRNHMLATGDPKFKAAALAFLERNSHRT